MKPRTICLSLRNARSEAALTLVEVMVSVLLIVVGLGSIFAVNSESAHTLRRAREASVASLILQQRIESMRTRQWAEISSAPALAALMQQGTDSDQELPGFFGEVVTVSVVEGSDEGPKSSAQSFRVRRENQTVFVDATGDLSKFPTLLVQSSVKWKDRGRFLERTQRSIICRAGLTRSGIFGSATGRMNPLPIASAE